MSRFLFRFKYSTSLASNVSNEWRISDACVRVWVCVQNCIWSMKSRTNKNQWEKKDLIFFCYVQNSKSFWSLSIWNSTGQIVDLVNLFDHLSNDNECVRAHFSVEGSHQTENKDNPNEKTRNPWTETLQKAAVCACAVYSDLNADWILVKLLTKN